MRSSIKCINCRNITLNRKFCSMRCKTEYEVKHRINPFTRSDIQQKLGQRAAKQNKVNKQGLYNPKIQISGSYAAHKKHPTLAKENGQKAQITLKKKNHGFYNMKWQKQHHQYLIENDLGIYSDDSKNKVKQNQRKYKLGFHDPKIQSLGGKSAHIKHPNLAHRLGLISSSKIKQNSKYKWNNIGFLSKSELQCAKQILSEPIDGINCHVTIGHNIIDFCPRDSDVLFQNKFVEFHPCNNWLHPESYRQYYNQRRKILDDNGFKNKDLIVIQNIKELTHHDNI